MWALRYPDKIDAAGIRAVTERTEDTEITEELSPVRAAFHGEPVLFGGSPELCVFVGWGRGLERGFFWDGARAARS